MTPYKISCAKALTLLRVSLGLGGAAQHVLDLFRDTMHAAEAQIPATHPYTPLCVHSAHADVDMQGDRFVLRARMLLVRGWDLKMSLQVYRNFLFCFPAIPFEIEAARLLERRQLVDQFGYTFGNVLADCFSDAGAQPYMRALLLKEHTNVSRSYTDGVVSFEFPLQDVYRRDATISAPPSIRFIHPGGAPMSDTPSHVSEPEARAIYWEKTGMALCPPASLHPAALDYAQTVGPTQPESGDVEGG